jgi:hypothetical protein
MKPQTREWYCGPATLQNALYVFGLPSVTQHKIAKLCGTTEEDGSDSDDMLRGAMALELSVSPWHEQNWQTIFYNIRETIAEGGAVALCTDSWEHWVLAFATRNYDHVVVCDPATTNKPHIRIYDSKSLSVRCFSKNKKPYYAIGLYPQHLEIPF